jgi:hypothetical protein
MESVGYMLVYLIKGSLTWQGLEKKTKENPITIKYFWETAKQTDQTVTK